MRRGLFLLLWLCPWVQAAEPPLPPSEAQLTQWIAQLGDDDFQVREQAEANLRQAGRLALPLVKQALEDKDQQLEAKARLRRIREGLLLWDGKESVAAYAALASLKADGLLALGGDVTMDLLLVPAGRFLMGSPGTEEGRVENEGPQHEVTLTQAFYMGKYAVTQAQYEKVMGNNPNHFKDGADAPRRPVEQVSWDEAQEFCKKLSENTGKTVRLPTEAEWEYACRAGTKTRCYAGEADEDLDGVAWYAKNSDSRTHPVGEKKANAWGLYDMHGNVWQACQDFYGAYEAGAAVDPPGAAQGAVHVNRGGSWFDSPQVCRSAFRNRSPPNGRDGRLGFRVVVVVARRTP